MSFKIFADWRVRIGGVLVALLVVPIAAGVCCRSISQEPFKLTLVAMDDQGGSDAAISPDGRWIVASSRRSGNWDLWIFDRQTNKWSQATQDPADDIEGQWSPDGSEIAFTSTRTGNKDVFVLTLATGRSRQLTDSPDDDEYPNWSPDGRSIVYTGGPWRARDFYVMSAGGSHKRRITQQSGWAGACSFHPDGRSVVCHRYDMGSGDVVQIPLDGSPMLTLTSDPAWDYKPTISRNNRWLAFSRSLEGPARIWLQPVGGGPGKPLDMGLDEDRWPTWTRSGETLMFHRRVERGTGVYYIDPTQKEPQLVVGAEEGPMQAAFAPDARRVVYCATEGDRRELRLVDLTSGARKTLPVPGGRQACFPRWAPQGERIAFLALEDGRWQLATMDVPGQDYKVWTANRPDLHGLWGLIDWSPDGTRLVFKGDTQPFASDLFVLDTRDGSFHNLTSDEAYDESPAFTPDGDGVVFMSTRGGDWTWGLFQLSLSTRAITSLTTPNYREKNHVRRGPRGQIIWTDEGERGRETLVELTPEGARINRPGLPAGARWASYSTGGERLIFTAVEHRTEYWVAENLTEEGSPLLSRAASPTGGAADLACARRDRSADEILASAGGPRGRSPVKLDHR